jgi:hypothetical protein
MPRTSVNWREVSRYEIEAREINSRKDGKAGSLACEQLKTYRLTTFQAKAFLKFRPASILKISFRNKNPANQKSWYLPRIIHRGRFIFAAN